MKMKIVTLKLLTRTLKNTTLKKKSAVRTETVLFIMQFKYM